jgi:hypothetical protein
MSPDHINTLRDSLSNLADEFWSEALEDYEDDKDKCTLVKETLSFIKVKTKIKFCPVTLDKPKPAVPVVTRILVEEFPAYEEILNNPDNVYCRTLSETVNVLAYRRADELGISVRLEHEAPSSVYAGHIRLLMSGKFSVWGLGAGRKVRHAKTLQEGVNILCAGE